MKKRILVVDDDGLVLRTLRKLLERQGHEIESYKSASEALGRCEVSNFNVILSDIRMPGMDGIEFVKNLRIIDQQKNQKTPVIFMTGYANDDAPTQAVALEAVDYILKPFDLDLVMSCINKALES